MATVLRLRDDSDVVRIIVALVETAEATAANPAATEADRNEARARMILSNKLCRVSRAADLAPSYPASMPTAPHLPARVFGAYESSGRWDRSLGPLSASVDRLQRVKLGADRIPVSLGVHTEMDRDQLEAAFTRQPGHWGHVRLDQSDAAQMVATIDRNVWQVRGARALELSSILIRTSKGHTLPQPTMLEVTLDHVATGARLYLEGMHWPLQNTARRRQASAEVRRRLVAHWAHLTTTDPDAGVLHLGDLNLDLRTRERRVVLDVVSQVPGFHQSWSLGNLPAQGTHERALIDNGLTNLPIRGGGAKLLPDDPSSDHRPWGCLYVLPQIVDRRQPVRDAPSAVRSWDVDLAA